MKIEAKMVHGQAMSEPTKSENTLWPKFEKETPSLLL
jgi:hypothetical protein